MDSETPNAKYPSHSAVRTLSLRRISGDDGADPTDFGFAWFAVDDDCLDEEAPESADTGIRVKCSKGILICNSIKVNLELELLSPLKQYLCTAFAANLLLAELTPHAPTEEAESGLHAEEAYLKRIISW